MDKATIITTFYGLVDDSTLDPILAATILNQVKNTLEAQRVWLLLRTRDVTQTANTGDTFETFHDLPDDFALPSQKGIYVGNDIIPYGQIPFEDAIRFQDITHRYYLDLANNQYALCGVANPGGTIYFYYQKFSPDLIDDGDEWIFPSRFHTVLPYLMAIKYFSIDQGDKSRSYDDRWDTFAKEIIESMTDWNARLQVTANQNSSLAVDISARPDIVDIDGDSSGVFYG